MRSAITAHNVIINGDYEGDVDCGGRFEIGSTGRVKGKVKTQVLVVKEGAHWEGSVIMTHEGRRASRRRRQPSHGSMQVAGPAAGGRRRSGRARAASSASRTARPLPAASAPATGPGTDNGQ